MTTKTPASYAQSLPFEVVEAIFKHFPAKLWIQRCHRFPWFLGHICSWWRSVFLGMTAQFWSFIGLFWEQPPSPVFKPSFVAGIMEFFLRRSSKDPFSFFFASLSLSLNGYTAIEWAHLLSILVEESPRWSNVSLLIDESLTSVLDRTRNRVPLLEDLVLYLWKRMDRRGSDHIHISYFIADVFAGAPSLTRVSLHEILRWKFNWPALTKLGLRRTGDVPNFLAVLSQMQNLERLDIEEEYSSDNRSFRPVTLPSLKRLHSCGTSLFSVLTAPALQQLSIDFSLAHDFIPNTVTSFLNRSGCTILKLKLSLCRATKVIEIVRDIPHIVDLSLNHTMDLKDSLDWLTQYRGQQCPARHLQSLTIVSSVTLIPVEEVEALRELIISRSNETNYEDVGKLKSLTIKDPDPETQIERFGKVMRACNDLQIQFHCQ